MPAPDLQKILLTTAAVLCVLIVAIVVRGGGYGIGGISWDSHLFIKRANLQLGPMTVLPGDRIRSVHSREVHRDADLRGVLRAAPEDEIWLEVERQDYEVAVPLTPELIEEGRLPLTLQGPYQVVAIDDRGVYGAMNVAEMASWMRANNGAPSVFTVSLPDYSFQGPATRVVRPGPIIPVVLLVLSLGIVVLAFLRGRSEVMGRLRQTWYLLGITSVCGGSLLAFLVWQDGFLADPVLLPFGLIALCTWRPLALMFHQTRRGRWLGPGARFVRLAAALPAAILLLTVVYGWSRTLPDLSGNPLDGFIFDQLRLVVLVAAAVLVLYHTADLALQWRQRRDGGGRLGALDMPWIAMVLASFAVLSACVHASADPVAFIEDGYTYHLAGLVAVQWLGDLSLLPKWADVEPALFDEGARLTLVDYLQAAARSLELTDPQFVCRRPLVSVALALSEDEELVPAPLDERLTGLLELLDEEGGMFPRNKRVHGTDELDDDPFDGLDRAVGVELVLPLVPPSGVRLYGQILSAYLVSRAPQSGEGVQPWLDVDSLQAWQRRFSERAENWTMLRAAAAEGACELLAASALALGPAAEETSEEAPSEVLVETSRKAPAAAPPAAPISEPPTDRNGALHAALHYQRLAIDSRYPVQEPELVSSDELERARPFASSPRPMLITGEAGTGHEFSARLIHHLSGAEGAFVVLDCTQIPQALVMAELVGEEDCPGRLAAAQNGTLCIRNLSQLGEERIAEIVTAARGSSARLILVERAGDPEAVLQESPGIRRAVDEAVLGLEPLRERPDDVIRAAVYYLHRHAMRLGRVVTGFDAGATGWLRERAWPANYESLIACVREAVVRCTGDTVTLAELTGTLETATEPPQTMEELERAALIDALERAEGNKSQAARLLGMKRTTFVRRLGKYELG